MKQERYWLRGGIIFSVTSLVLGFFLAGAVFTSGFTGDKGIIIHIIQSIFLTVSAPGLFVKNFMGFPTGIGIAICVTFISWFLIGSILGWIYGKIKSGNQNWLWGSIIGLVLFFLLIIVFIPYP